MVKCGFSQNSRHLSAVIFYFFWVTEVKSWFFLLPDYNPLPPSLPPSPTIPLESVAAQPSRKTGRV
jgi:hypothetical protein